MMRDGVLGVVLVGAVVALLPLFAGHLLLSVTIYGTMGAVVLATLSVTRIPLRNAVDAVLPDVEPLRLTEQTTVDLASDGEIAISQTASSNTPDPPSVHHRQ